MARALELARRAEGRVSPRPPVGAVVVSGEDRVIGEGFTTAGRGNHAELAALMEAGDARHATVFTTLEPCVEWCAPALITAAVSRVCIATTDPNPKVDGRGVAMLRDAGIIVQHGVLRQEAEALIEPFATWIRTGRPFVTLKLAASLDGKIAAPDGTSQWITGEASRAEVHDLRRRVDAVIVGSGTAVADDPQLTFRTPGLDGDQPLRVVFDSSCRTPTNAKLFPALIVTTTDAAVPAYEQAEIVRVARAEGGVDVIEALQALGERGLCHVLVEAGPTLASTFMERALVDRFVLYLAPKIIGGDAPGLFAGGVKTLTDSWDLEILDVTRVGSDIRIDARRAA